MESEGRFDIFAMSKNYGVENSKEFSKETKKEGSNTILREELSDRRQIYRAKSR